MTSLPKVYIFMLIISLGCFSACKRENLLNARPQSDLFVPSTLADLQPLLDNDAIMGETPVLGEISGDNYYLTTSFWQSLNIKEHNAYIWASDIFGTQGNTDDWFLPYQQVSYANVVLEGVNTIPANSQNLQTRNAIKGSALFMRAYAFYNLAQIFAAPYDSKSASTDPGIPLRLSSSIDYVSTRATIEQTYNQVLSDITAAKALLPVAIDSTYRNRPSLPACLALLARVYLGMGKYTLAGAYADSCLQLYNKLMDYNKIDTQTAYPFSRLNDEVLYQSRLLSTSTVLVPKAAPGCIVDSVLYQSYASGDLRRQAFYIINTAGLPNIRSSYSGLIFGFSGLATDEIYLIRAECMARSGNTQASMNDLNTLLQNRWKAGSFIPLSAVSANAALQEILVERRKELPFRGLRWTDIRRLNKEGAQITLTRLINNQSYQLLPGDQRYLLPIPPDVIAQTGMMQNPR